ncbi:MAG: HD domain-containing phosphohydrolase [Planctomycetota bacterium]
MGKSHDILIVDDEGGHRALLSEMVESVGFSADTASDGFEAMAKIKVGFDLVLLDAQMPGMDGFEVAERIRKDEKNRNVPIVMVTGLDSPENKKRSWQVGADAFIAKPVQLDEVQSTLIEMLGTQTRAAEDDHPEGPPSGEDASDGEVGSYVSELTRAQREAYSAHLETLERLAIAAEYRDEATGAHVRRIGSYCALIGECIHLRPGEVEVLRYASPLHDLGKIAIPDFVLLKEGKLNADEWRIMKRHPEIGSEILSGSSSKFLQAGEQIALTHQEKWDGSGYPRGLKGEDIPLYGRICTVADVYDALTHMRPYRPALSSDEAIEIMQNQRGEHFDPELLDVFWDNIDMVFDIQKKHEDQ